MLFKSEGKIQMFRTKKNWDFDLHALIEGSVTEGPSKEGIQPRRKEGDERSNTEGKKVYVWESLNKPCT